MSFILRAQRATWPETFRSDWDRYEAYLRAHRERFPPQAYSLATSSWYHDASTSRCPHDAWLEAVTMTEPASGERNEERTLALSIRLLGSYHDGYLRFEYPRVFRYEVRGESVSEGHGDWLYDEFRVGEADRLIHEIEWASGSRWLIEASDVVFTWLPGGPKVGPSGPDA